MPDADPPLPQRPRSHELEAESRRAFESALPSLWTTGAPADDYGVDLEVEIFSDNAATGMKFAVQLKGTDQADIEDALRVRMKRSTIRYLRQLDVPVLVVRYHAPTGTLYTNWLDEFRYSAGETESVTLRFKMDDAWSLESPARIESRVSALRRWKAGDPQTPIEVLVNLGDPDPGTTQNLLVRELRRSLADVSDLLSFTAESSSAPFTVSVSDDELSVDLLGTASFTWTHRHGDEVQGEARARSVQMLVGFVLDITGKTELAGRLLQALRPDSPLLFDDTSAFAVGEILGSSSRIDSAIEIAQQLAEHGVSGLHAGRSLEAGLRLGLSPEVHRNLKVIRKLIENSRALLALPNIETVAQDSAASIHYSLANLLFQAGEYADALHHYRQAANLNPGYRSRGYWWGETGAALFELGRYRLAARFYAYAQAIDTDGLDHRARQADALMHAGLYAAASDLFAAYLSDEQNAEPWWVVKGELLRYWMEHGGLEDQERLPDRATALAAAAADESGDVLAQAMFDALDEDYLSHEAWEGVGRAAAEVGNAELARIAFLMAIVSDPSCVGAFVAAVGFHIGHPDAASIVPLLIAFGYRLHGDQFIDEFLEEFADVVGSLPIEVADAVEQIVTSTSIPGTGITVRFT